MELLPRDGAPADAGPPKPNPLAKAAAALLVLATIAVVTTLVLMRGYAALDAGQNSSQVENETTARQSVISDLDPFLPDDATSYKAPPPPEQVPWIPGQTVVSLTFDDGFSSQSDAAKLMDGYGFPGTFYINSGSIGKPGYLTLENLRTIADKGHEIGGHTVSHPNLPLPTAEVKRDICLDRATLSHWGFIVRNFAYPYAAVNDEVRAAAMDCGYNTARGLGDVRTRFGCLDCAWAETIPPSVIDYTAAPNHVTDEWTLEDLKSVVSSAQPAGGWVQLTFHGLCTSQCDNISVTETVFAEFLSWLKVQTQTTKTVVHSVEMVVGGPNQPLVAGPEGRAAPTSGTNALANPGLREIGSIPAGLPPNVSTSDAVPQCWQPDSYGTHQALFKMISPGRSDDAAAHVQVEGYQDGEAKLLQKTDLGLCTPGVAPGRIYSLEAWYKSSVATQFSLYYRLERGVWVYWTSSPFFPASEEYAQATWTSPPIPEGVTGISFGLSLLENGQLTTDDYVLRELQETQTE